MKHRISHLQLLLDCIAGIIYYGIQQALPDKNIIRGTAKEQNRVGNELDILTYLIEIEPANQIIL